MNYEYKMIQMPPAIEIKSKQFKGNEAAAYLESLINKYAKEGWEFWRIDSIGLSIAPGCLVGFLGGKAKTITYYVVTFRKIRN